MQRIQKSFQVVAVDKLELTAPNQKDKRNKFKPYEPQYYYDEEEQLLLQQQRLIMEEEETLAAAAADDKDESTVKAKQSSLQQVLNVNSSIGNIISSSHSTGGGLNNYCSSSNSSCSCSIFSGTTGGICSGGTTGNTGETFTTYPTGYVIPIRQQYWQTKFTTTIKQVLIVLVPFLGLSDLVSLSLTCTALASTTDIDTAIPLSAVANSNITASESFSQSGLAAESATAATTLRNRMHVRTILETNLQKVISRFKLTIEALQVIFKLHPGTVLSGSSILQAYLGEQYESYDLDFYVPLQEDSQLFLTQTLRMHDTEYHKKQGTIDMI